MNVDRGMTGRLKRLPELDLESYNDFLTGMRSWMFRGLSAATAARAEELTQQETKRGGNLSFDRAREIFGADQKVAVSQRMWISCQLMAHHGLLNGFRRHEEDEKKRFERAEHSDIGSMELNPDLEIPDYARHEIHVQPGGYVGEPLAGHVYHYGTNSFYLGWNDQDEVYYARAKELTLPEDGKVERILDLGSCVGQYPLALKDTYPQAEVWGIEVGEPLVRYAHTRAVELGVDVHFAQRLAEDTKFPDGYFDVVSAHIVFHEVSDEGAANIIREAARIIRPGGVFDIIDFKTGGDVTPYREYQMWADHHYNGERWTAEFHNRPFVAMLESAGFEVSYADPALSMGGLKKYVARKPLRQKA
jgi:ubiquinone/menaquinone biosynthesis C-methylase UbiE